MFININNGQIEFHPGEFDGPDTVRFYPEDIDGMVNYCIDHKVRDAMCSSSVDFSEEEGVADAGQIIDLVFEMVR